MLPASTLSTGLRISAVECETCANYTIPRQDADRFVGSTWLQPSQWHREVPSCKDSEGYVPGRATWVSWLPFRPTASQ
jgi:hypothetical protein